jgi:hypothetical protein
MRDAGTGTGTDVPQCGGIEWSSAWDKSLSSEGVPVSIGTKSHGRTGYAATQAVLFQSAAESTAQGDITATIDLWSLHPYAAEETRTCTVFLSSI